MEQRSPLWTRQNLVIERGNPLWSLKEEQGHSNLSLETMETEMSVESRSFLNRMNDQVRKRQKRSSMNVTENEEKTFYDMENDHVCNNGISSIHEKELPEQLSFHREYKRFHNETNVRHICEIGVGTRWDLWIGNTWLE